jgi:hypothetical protein
VETVAVARAEDPELQELAQIIDAWRVEIGVGKSCHWTAGEILAKTQEKGVCYEDDGRPIHGDDWRYPALREAVEAMGLNKQSPGRAFGKRLAKYKGRLVNGHRLASLPSSGSNTLRWYLERL